MNVSPKRIIALFFYAIVLLIVLCLVIMNDSKPFYKKLQTKPTVEEQVEKAKIQQIPKTRVGGVLEDY